MKKHSDNQNKNVIYRKIATRGPSKSVKNKIIFTVLFLTALISIFIGLYVIWTIYNGNGKNSSLSSSHLTSNNYNSNASILNSNSYSNSYSNSKINESEFVSSGNNSDGSFSTSSNPTTDISSLISSGSKSSSIINSSISASTAIISTLREGWSYTPAGKQGVIATTTNHRMTLCSNYNGIWQGDSTKKRIYITMDVGYEYNNNATKILDIAKKKNVKINFFITGALFKSDELKSIVLRMRNEGHLVANHTYNHPSMPVLFNKSGESKIKDEITSLENEYLKLTGYNISKFIRPPMGEYSEATMKLCSEMGYKTVFWSFAYRDWIVDSQPDLAAAKKTILANLHNGVIYLLHTVSNTNVAILPDLIDEIRNQGYEIALLSDYQ